MNELLDFGRREFTVADWRQEEESGHIYRINQEEANAAFNHFLEVRVTMQAAQNDMKNGAVLFGWGLKELQESRVFEYVCPKVDEGSYTSKMGYTSFYKFCKAVFGIKERTARRMIAVAKEFCGYAFNQDGEPTTIGVQLPYVNFSYSQLSEMVNINDEYRLRIPSTTSCRDIVKLRKLYEVYPPVPGTTVADDLEKYKKLKEEENAEKSKAKNKLCFIPANRPTLADGKSSSDQGEKTNRQTSAGCNVSSNVEDFSDEESDVITPTNDNIKFEDIRDGLKIQLDLLGSLSPGWNVFSERVKTALEKEDAMHLIEYSRVRELRSENIRLTVAASQSNVEVNDVPIGERLNLKNEKARRDWIDNFRKWHVWINVPDVGQTFYRYNFKNGCALIVEVAQAYVRYSTGPHKETYLTRYCILDDAHPKFDFDFQGGKSAVVDWLTKHSKEI